MSTPNHGPVQIADAERPDIDILAAIWHQGWHDGHAGFVPDEVLGERTLPDFLRRVEAGLSAFHLARVGTEIAGFYVVVDDELEQIYVHGSHRGSGVASALIAAAEAHIADQGHDAAWLAVVAGNARAQAFYAKQGWSDAGPIVYQAAGRDGLIEIATQRYEKRLS